MKKRTEAVDIIIPVYNGYDDLQLCMPSVLKHTDLTKHRLILINDCSPDERIAPYLDSFAGEHILVPIGTAAANFNGLISIAAASAKQFDTCLSQVLPLMPTNTSSRCSRVRGRRIVTVVFSSI